MSLASQDSIVAEKIAASIISTKDASPKGTVRQNRGHSLPNTPGN